MRWSLRGLLALGLIALTGFSPAVPSAPELDSTRTPTVSVTADTVHVASPTGEQETDRSSILAALDEVEPGGTVQFAPGTYLVGEVVPLETPRVILLGHPTARPCAVAIRPGTRSSNARQSGRSRRENPIPPGRCTAAAGCSRSLVGT